MLKKILFKLYKATNLVIVYQLVSMPTAYSFAHKTLNNEGKQSEDNWNLVGDVATFLASGINATTTAMQQARQPQDQTDVFYNQLAPGLKIQPIDQSQVPPVFGNCIVLPARNNQISKALSCTEQPPEKIQAGYASAMIKLAEENMNDLNNYMTQGHERITTQGVGCYNKGMENFNAMLLSREEELSKYRENLKKLLDQFNTDAKLDIEGIKHTTAILDGKKSKDSDKYIKDLKFEDILLGKKSDPNNVCGSFLNGDALKKYGEDGGLRNIEDQIFKEMNKSGNNRMGAEEMLSKASAMEKDIDTYADKLSSHMRNNKLSSISGNEISFRGKAFSKNNKALTEIISSFNTDLQNKFSTLETTARITNTLENNELDSIFSQVKADSLDRSELESKLAIYERDQKNKCLAGAYKEAGFNDMSSFIYSFKDPNISKGLAKEADNAMASKLMSILNDDDLTIDQKMKLVNAEQSKGRNDNYTMETGKTFTFNGKPIYASTRLRPAQMINMFVQACTNRFNSGTDGNSSGYSRQNAIDTLKNYAIQRENTRKLASTDLAENIKDQLKDCPGDPAGTAKLSCNGALNTNNENFCIRTATKCASNMKGCYETAKGQVAKVKADQDNFVKNYEANVETFKKNLKTELIAINSFLESQARSLDAQLNLGTVFQIPGIDTEFSEELLLGQAQGIDPSLAIEDPKAYLNKVSGDIQKLEKALEKQRIEFVGSNGQGGKLGKIKSDYIASYRKNVKTWDGIISDCMSARQAAQQNIQKQAEATNKNNETISEACEDLQAFQAKPEEGEVAELANSLAKAVQLQAGSPLGKQMSAQDQRALQEIRSFSASCAGSDSDANILRPSDVKNGMVTVESFCDNQDARELYKDLGAEELCSKGPEDTCSKKDFLAQLKNVKDKLCLNKDTGELHLSKGLGCPENSKVSESILTNPDNYETVKEVANIKNLCKVQSRDIASIEDKLKPMVNGYNCHIASKKAGQLGVSVCNADMAQTGLNGKGILQQASSDIFRAYGASRSLEN